MTTACHNNKCRECGGITIHVESLAKRPDEICSSCGGEFVNLIHCDCELKSLREMLAIYREGAGEMIHALKSLNYGRAADIPQWALEQAQDCRVKWESLQYGVKPDYVAIREEGKDS